MTSHPGHARRGPEHDLRTLTAELSRPGGPAYGWAAAPRPSSASTPRDGRRPGSGSQALLDPGSPSLEIGLVGCVSDVRRVGRRGRRGRRHGDRLGRRPARDGRRQRRDGQGGRMLPDDDQEDPPRPDDRRAEPAARSSISSTRRAPSCRCKTRSFPTKTTSGGSFATTRCSRRPAFRSTPPSWATASRAGRICRSCATPS